MVAAHLYIKPQWVASSGKGNFGNPNRKINRFIIRINELEGKQKGNLKVI